MFHKIRVIFPAGLVALAIASSAFAQTDPTKPATEDKPAKNELASKPAKKEEKIKPQVVDVTKLTAEQVVESTILIYSGSVLGRQSLNQIRKTSYEKGKLQVTSPNGRVDNAEYQRWILRGESLEKEKVKLEQKYPDTTYSLIYTGDKIFGVYNDSVFTPREDASAAFMSQIWNGIDGLLRYKENGSTLEMSSREKIMGVDYFLIDVTDKEKRKTRYYVSVKSFRVMMLDYEAGSVKYRRKFYDYRYAQGTLVPYRTVLLQGDKQIEEMTIGTITFGQKVEEDVFKES